MNTFDLSSRINPLKLALVTILFLSFGYFPRGTSFFYFIPAITFLSVIVLSKYSVSNKFIIIAFTIFALIPFSSSVIITDFARDLVFLIYFFAAALIGHSLARYMPVKYLVYGLFLAGAYASASVLVKLITGFQGDFSLVAIREITGGAGDYGIILIIISFYGMRKFPLLLIFVASLLLMSFTQSRTMLASLLIWIYFLISLKTGVLFNWLMRLTVFFLIAALVIVGANADSDSFTFFGKILRSFQELIPDESQNINSNWRAVESAVALSTILNGSFFEILFGKGMGFRLPLGFEMTLANVEFDSIPILHNGYLYILLKYGVIGLFLWFKFLRSLLLRSGDPLLVTISKSCFFIIIVTQFFSGGVLQYQGLIFLVIMAACSTLNSKYVRDYS